MRILMSVAVGCLLAVSSGCQVSGSAGGGGARASTQVGGGESGGGGGGAQLASAKSGNPDALYMVETAHMSHAEIAASELALRKTNNPQVREFAQQMITDHTAANQQLMTIAQQKGVAIPKRPDELHTKGAAAMANMEGSQFDREYMSCMTSDHAKLLSSTEDKAATASDPDVRSFAASQVPVVRHHYQMALELNRSLGGAATGNARAGAATGTRRSTGGAGADVDVDVDVSAGR